MPLSHSQTNQLLQSLGHEPRKQLGQNFLIDGNIVEKSVRMANLKPGEQVVEVGPGLGTLTECMLEKGAEVYAVEFDRRLYQHLCESLLPRFAQTLHLLHADAVDHPLAQLPVRPLLEAAQQTQPAATRQRGFPSQPVAQPTGNTSEPATQPTGAGHAQAEPAATPLPAPGLTLTADFKIIANLPYAISTPWLESVLSGPVRPRALVLMLQKEAAERFVAEPGSKTYGAISIFTASAYRMAASHSVSRQCFYPIPGVDSVLLSLEALPAPQPWPPLARYFVRQFFIHRRKQIGSLVRRAIETLEQPARPEKLSAKARRAAAQDGGQATAGDNAAIDSTQTGGETRSTQTTESGGAAADSPVQLSKEQAQHAAQHLEHWLADLHQLGIALETRPEAVPLKGWQQLAQRFHQSA